MKTFAPGTRIELGDIIVIESRPFSRAEKLRVGDMILLHNKPCLVIGADIERLKSAPAFMDVFLFVDGQFSKWVTERWSEVEVLS